MGILGLAGSLMGRGALGLAKGAATGGFAARVTIGAGVGGIAGAIEGDYANPNARIENILKGAAIGGMIGGAVGLNKTIGRMRSAGRTVPELRRAAEETVGSHQLARWMKDPRFAAQFEKDMAEMSRLQPWQETPTSLLARNIGGRFKKAFTGPAGEGLLAKNKRIGQERLRSYLGDTMGAETFVQRRGDIAARYSPIGRAMALPGQVLSTAVNHPYLMLGGAGIAGAGYLASNAPKSPTLRGDVEAANRGLAVTTKINYNTGELAANALRESGVAPMGMVGTVPQMMGPMQQAFQRSTSGMVQGMHRGRHG